MFSVVNQANSVVYRDLAEWSQIATELVNQVQTMPIDLQLRIRIQSNAALISMISDEILFEPSRRCAVANRLWHKLVFYIFRLCLLVVKCLIGVVLLTQLRL